MKTKQKIQITHFFLFIYLSFIVCSCQVVPTSSYVKYTKLEDNNCEEKAGNVFLFFENEKIDFKYQKLGFVQISQAVSTENAINLMKHKTQEMCGNAIINFKIVKTSEVETDYEKNINTTIHTSYSAISVKIDENSDYWIQ